MEETYKPIKNLENKYLISNNGNVKSIVSNKILKMRDAVDGYLTVKLGTKQYFIHKLVIENFSNEKKLDVVDHIDGNKKNNNISNLRYATFSQNTKNAYVNNPNMKKILTNEKFLSIKSKYGYVSSWAIWANKTTKEKSNMDDISFFDDIKDIKFNPNIILVGLNISEKIKRPFGNFHPVNTSAHDYKIRYAVKDTMISGAYMTDIIKDFEEKVSNNLMKYLRDNPDFLKENINSFEDELKNIDSKNPVLIAFGNDCYKILINNLKYPVYKVSHYSSCISKEKLRDEFSEIIQKITV